MRVRRRHLVLGRVSAGSLSQRVVVDARSMLIFAGWVPQGGVRQELSAGLRSSVTIGVVAHSRIADGLLALLVRSLTGPSKSWVVAYSGSCSRVARDQHQPASSRAIAVLATVCFLCRAV